MAEKISLTPQYVCGVSGLRRLNNLGPIRAVEQHEASEHEIGDPLRRRIAALEAALRDICRLHPEGLHKSAADAFIECQAIADRALNQINRAAP